MKVISALILLLLLYAAICRDKRKTVLDKAKSHGILIKGEHCKVYKIYRTSSYTDGGLSRKYHNIKYFGEIIVEYPDGSRIHISEEHLRYCLKVRKHERTKTKINGIWTDKWSEWRIDPNGDDEIHNKHDLYYSTY